MSHKLTQQMSHNLESLPRSRDGLWKRRHPRQKFSTFLRSCNLAMVCCCEKMCDFSATCPRFATVSILTSSISIKCNIDIFCFWFLCCHLYTQAHSEHQEEISKFGIPDFLTIKTTNSPDNRGSTASFDSRRDAEISALQQRLEVRQCVVGKTKTRLLELIENL